MAAGSGLSATERVIRPARHADLDELARTHLAAFVAGNGPSLSPAALAGITVERMREQWKRHLDDPPAGRLLLVAESGGRIVGTAASGPPLDDDLDATTTGALYALYVEPGGWGLGHGVALHDAALAHLVAGGCDRAVLWVLEGNARARSFYVAHGWSTDGARQEWEGAPIVRMARALRPDEHGDPGCPSR